MEYYINKPVCQETNKKLRALSALLKEYESSIIEFSDTFTPEDLKEKFADWLNRANIGSNSKPLEVRLDSYGGALTYAFYTIPSNGEAVAIMRLRPVLKRISAFTMTNDKTEQL